MAESLGIVDYLARRRDLVVEQIQAIIPKDQRHSGGLYELMLDYPLRPSKGIRPALSIAVCRGAGGTFSAVLPTAAVLELYHNAFLVHDDIEDRSDKRRHEATLNRLHGMPAAVNVGDGMLALAIQPLLDNIELIGLGKALKILRVVSRMARETAEGQMIELQWIKSCRWTQSDLDYVRLVHKKTAWYSFIAPMMIGAIAAGLKDDDIASFGRAGIPLGIAFQIQDDILNLETDSEIYGKDHCADLWEGKHTLILIHALRCADQRERDEALLILRKPQSADERAPDGVETRSGEGPKTAVDIGVLRNLVDRYDGIGYARAIARRHAQRFRRVLDSLVGNWPPSEHRDFLIELSDFTIRRTI